MYTRMQVVVRRQVHLENQDQMQKEKDQKDPLQARAYPQAFSQHIDFPCFRRQQFFQSIQGESAVCLESVFDMLLCLVGEACGVWTNSIRDIRGYTPISQDLFVRCAIGVGFVLHQDQE